MDDEPVIRPRALAAVTRERDRLAVAAPAATARAERLLEVASAVLRARPPEGIEPAYIDAFVARRRAELVALVRGAFGA